MVSQRLLLGDEELLGEDRDEALLLDDRDVLLEEVGRVNC